ncbi:MAG: DNA-processing protein DprA, partial [Pseudomonadota bacterium]
LISGLSDGVVVLEGALKSGSLITARDALDQGREVMAVPGHPVDARAGGCNALIRDGAVLVRGAEDVLSALGRGLPAKPVPAARRAKTGPKARAATQAATGRTDNPTVDVLLNLIGPTPVAEDLLIRQSGLPAGEVLQTLTELEITQRVERHAGGSVSRSSAQV